MNHFEYGFFDELEKIAGMGSGALKGLALGGLLGEAKKKSAPLK